MNLVSPLPSPVLLESLQSAMQRCRSLTLALFSEVDYATFCAQAHPDFSPIGWHLGHIAFTESRWMLEHLAGQAPQFPEYHRLYAADGLSKHDRVHLPTLAETQSYLSTVRAQVFTYLQVAPLLEQERLWVWLLQHESQHAETIALVVELLRRAEAGGLEGRGARGLEGSESPQLPNSPTPQLTIPAGDFTCGNPSIAALDNERPAHRVYLKSYQIDRYPVTCGQYRNFMQAGGYHDSQWWTGAGWEWLRTAQVTQPLYWRAALEFGNHPVCGVNGFEAEAYARFVGKRLPTEWEWEKAACWNPETQQSQTYPWGEASPTDDRCNHQHAIGHTTPVDAYPLGQSPSGCWDLLGNVWEWTASEFAGYPGFEAYPYPGYSQVYFDGQHRVLRGGSWVTRPWALRSSFRNWYHPHVREILAGFRCVAL